MKNSTQNRENKKKRGFFGQNFRSEILKPGLYTQNTVKF